jgi:hypothetical protein
MIILLFFFTFYGNTPIWILKQTIYNKEFAAKYTRIKEIFEYIKFGYIYRVFDKEVSKV